MPDWPVSFGRWLISSNNFVANVRYEYSHRFIAGVVGMTTLLLAVWVYAGERRSWMKKLALIAFAGVMAQAGIGGLRVLFPEHKALIAVPHALPHLESGALVRLAPQWYADAGSISIYHASRRLVPAKTRVFVDFVVNAFKSERLDVLFSANH